MRQLALRIRDSTRQKTVSFFDAGPVRRGLYSLVKGLHRHDAVQVASAMAFDLFLAAIPMIALAGWLSAQLLAERPEAVISIRAFAEWTPEQVHELLTRQFDRFSAGAVAPVALLGTLWLASGAYHTLMSVFETMVHARRRSWWTKRLLSMLGVIVTLLAFSATGFLAVNVAGGPSAVLRFFRPSDDNLAVTLSHSLTVCLMLLSTAGGMAAFFRLAVRRPGVRRRVWPGAFVTVAIGGLSSLLLAYYVREIARFAVFYGSLAAVAVTLAWIWVWCFAMLVGAELNAQLEGGDRTPPSRVLR